MIDNKHIVIDFDSTFLQVEALEELADIALSQRPDKDHVLNEIKEITSLGVDGKIPFNESLSRRVGVIKAHKDHLPVLIDRLKEKVSISIQRNRDFFERYRGNIFVISNGFREFIEPVVVEYHISPDQIRANSFRFDESGNIVGFDDENLLAHSKGKSKILQSLGLPGEIYVIGDSYTDYEMKEAGVAHKFFAFTENVLRENILDKADHVTPSFDEFLYVNKLPMALSYPKNRIKFLLLENIHPYAAKVLTEEGFLVETMGRALSEDELCDAIKDVSVIGIRSKTNITPKVLQHANRLMVVGAFCIGTNQIDLPACAEKGVVAFNAPYSNTRSVVELAIGQIIMLMRRIPEMNRAMHEGKWNKSAKNSYEVRGKKLGIVGYGNIGAQLSVLAESMGMDVYYYDVLEKLALGNATKCNTLDELLETVDVVTLHVDGRPENKDIFGAREFDKMRPGSIFLNLSRGFVVDIEALAERLRNGYLLGASIDVYPKEPKSRQADYQNVLTGIPNLIMTPHIGGSTQEAQRNIAEYVPNRIMDYINNGSTFGSVNFPNVQLPMLQNAHRLLHIHENVPGVLSQINRVLSDHGTNITGQYLKTNEQVGYVITDIDKEYNDEVLRNLKKINHTIKFRVLY